MEKISKISVILGMHKIYGGRSLRKIRSKYRINDFFQKYPLKKIRFILLYYEEIISAPKIMAKKNN